MTCRREEPVAEITATLRGEDRRGKVWTDQEQASRFCETLRSEYWKDPSVVNLRNHNQTGYVVFAIKDGRRTIFFADDERLDMDVPTAPEYALCRQCFFFEKSDGTESGWCSEHGQSKDDGDSCPDHALRPWGSR